MPLRPDPPESSVRPVTVERVSGRTSRPVIVAAVIILVLGTALLKPWDALRPETAVLPIATAAVAQVIRPTAPTPITDPVLQAASSRMLCNAPDGWRLVTAEEDPLGDTRTMYGTPPRPAEGPDDPSIARAELRADRMFAVGVCRPNPAGLRIADLPFNNVTIWFIPTHGEAVVLTGTRLLDQSLFRLGEAYYGPATSSLSRETPDGAAASWRPGRYVVEIADATGDAGDLWLGLDFVETGPVAWGE